MRDEELPTWPQIAKNTVAELDRSRDGLSEAGSWLRSDWKPGTVLTDAQADGRILARRLIGEAKELIDQAKQALAASPEA
jgi:hypothetical protein